MAKYNREFLVPYLQNVCALHLAYRKLDQKIHDLVYNDIPYLKRGKANPKPAKPQELDTISAGGYFSIVIGAFLLLVSLVSFLNDSSADASDFISFTFLVIVLALMIYLPIHSIKGRKKQNAYILYQYQQAMTEFEKVAEYNEKLREYVPVYEEHLEFYKKERDNIDVLLDKVYAVNVIPSRYRNIYAAVYLYDWFSTSRANDLDMALNMFVLEEIKEKLDTIITRQSESILNQRLILANQQRSLELQQRHSNMMRAKLNQIAASNEERNTYLSMIESNTAATAYFAAADYIRKI